MKQPIYLDYHATTPVDPRALEVMLPFFTERFGNASSRTHAFGWAASEAVDKARDQVASLIGAHHRDIVFTSGATESNNLAIKGAVRARGLDRPHVVTVATEHHSVLDTCHDLARAGAEVTVLPVQADGRVDLVALETCLTARTVLVSVMAANNEIGVLQPIEAIAEVAHRVGALVHTDASQAVGRVPVDVKTLGADLVSFTAHKMYGPKGVGALFIRKKVEIASIMHGGGQERGLRAGTLNVPGIVGFGAAARIAREELPAEGPRLRALRDRLLAGFQAQIPDVRVNGSLEHRVPGNLNVAFPGVDPDALRLAIDDVAVSFGSACSSGTTEPSHVIAALNPPREAALTSVRFGLGRWTTAEDVDYTIGKMAQVVAGLRRTPARVG